MKVTVIGSHLCPDTLYALNRLVEAKADIDFKNLSASLPDLKAYLALRESSPVFDGPKARGSLGIPCFVLEDGTVTLELEKVLGRVHQIQKQAQRPPGFRRALLCARAYWETAAGERSKASSSAGLPTICRAPWADRNPASRKPQLTEMQGRPAFWAVAMSTSESPTYTAPAGSAPSSARARNTVSGAGLRATPWDSPMATGSRSPK